MGARSEVALPLSVPKTTPRSLRYWRKTIEQLCSGEGGEGFRTVHSSATTRNPATETALTLGAQIPSILPSSQCLGALRRFRCFLGPRACVSRQTIRYGATDHICVNNTVDGERSTLQSMASITGVTGTCEVRMGSSSVQPSPY